MIFWLLALDVAISGQRRSVLPQTQSFEEIYERSYPLVLRYLTQLCGSAEQAEELAQETFVRAYTGMVRFRGDAAATTWLYRIARNTYLNSVRRPVPARLDSPSGQQIVDGTPAYDPVQAFADREAHASIAQTLAQLPEQQRSVLLLRDAEGLSYGEIADVLGLSVAAVRMKLFRARNLFRAIYTDHHEGTTDA